MKDLFYMSKIDYYSCKRIELSEVHTHSEFSLMGDSEIQQLSELRLIVLVNR